MTASRSRHLVDPELTPLLDLFPGLMLSAETLPDMRARAVARSRSSRNVMSGRQTPTANPLIRAVTSGGIIRATPW